MLDKMRKSKIIVAIFLTQMSFSAAKAQPAVCEKIVDTFFYVSVDIRGTQAYPVTMSGVGKEPLKGRLSTVSIDSFLVSFYRKYKYVPDPMWGYKKMLVFCTGDSLSMIENDLAKEEIATFIGKTSRLALHRKIKLQSGETAFVDIIKIGGIFWKVDPHSPGLAESSNEYPISKIPEISDCYVPYRIGFYQKPKPNDW
jgi:hypothetical protein